MINPNTGRNTDAKVQGDILDGILFGLRTSEESKMSDVIWDYPETLVELLNQFQKLWGIPEMAIPSKKQKSQYNNWILQLEKLRKLFSSDARMKIAMKYSFEKYQRSGKNLLIHEPASIYKIVVDGISDLRRQEQKQKSENEQKRKDEEEKGNLVNPNKFRKLRGE